MKILVINAGSSSLKFQLLESGEKFRVLCKGVVDGIGLKTCQFRLKAGEKETQKNVSCKNHHEALDMALRAMIVQKVIPSLDVIRAIGHRVVHGGEKYRKAAKITADTIRTIRDLSELAPLHNPPNLKAILACRKLLKNITQVAVFDTAFHETLPPKAYLYPLPYELYAKDGIRRYGFHGTSHKYVTEQAIKLLKKKNHAHGARARAGKSDSTSYGAHKIVSCHMGNGSSVAAVLDGKSVDTSMGLTPLEGIPMGTRSGDIDPAIIFHLIKAHHKNPQSVENMLIHDSGIKGLSGISSDVRDIRAAAIRKNKRALLTFEILAYRVAKYIGSYAAAMNGIDAIIFTAGIGENAWYLRSEICEYLTHLGVEIDPAKNKKNAVVISGKKSKVSVLVIPTDEELEIAKETLKIIKN
jgi:acetate kinase